MRVSLLAIPFTALAACGPVTNSEVTIGGVTLRPAAAHFWIGTTSSEAPNPFFSLVVTDQPGACAHFADMDGCKFLDAIEAVDGFSLREDGTHFVITSHERPARGERAIGPRAGAGFIALRNGELIASDEASSGSIEFTKVEEGVVEGRYDLKMRGGEEIAGTFTAQHCPARDAVASGMRELSEGCSDKATESSCSASCTCRGRTNTLECSRSSASSDWSCSCEFQGRRTTLSVPAQDACFETLFCPWQMF